MSSLKPRFAMSSVVLAAFALAGATGLCAEDISSVDYQKAAERTRLDSTDAAGKRLSRMIQETGMQPFATAAVTEKTEERSSEPPSQAAIGVLKQYQTAIANLSRRQFRRQLGSLFLQNDGTPEAMNREWHRRDVEIAFDEAMNSGKKMSLVFEDIKHKPVEDGSLISATIKYVANKNKPPLPVDIHVVPTDDGWKIRNITYVKDAIRPSWQLPEIRLTAGETYRMPYMMIEASQPLNLRMQGTPQPFRMEIIDDEGRKVEPEAGSPETFGANQEPAEYEQDHWHQVSREVYTLLEFSLPSNGYHLDVGTYKLRIHYSNRKPLKPSEDSRPGWTGEASSPWVRVVSAPRPDLSKRKTIDGLKLTVTLKNSRVRLAYKTLGRRSLEEPLVFQAVLQNTGTKHRTVGGPNIGRAWIANSSVRFKESKVADVGYEPPDPGSSIDVGSRSSHSFQYEAKSFYVLDGRRLTPGKFDCYLEFPGFHSNRVPLEILPSRE